MLEKVDTSLEAGEPLRSMHIIPESMRRIVLRLPITLKFLLYCQRF